MQPAQIGEALPILAGESRVIPRVRLGSSNPRNDSEVERLWMERPLHNTPALIKQRSDLLTRLDEVNV